MFYIDVVHIREENDVSRAKQRSQMFQNVNNSTSLSFPSMKSTCCKDNIVDLSDGMSERKSTAHKYRRSIMHDRRQVGHHGLGPDDEALAGDAVVLGVLTEHEDVE